MNPKIVNRVSFTLVPCMLAVVTSDAYQGKLAHLAPAAPLVLKVATSAVTSFASLDYVQHNTVTDAEHMASVPQDSELRLGGLE
jgi:hypothetical protein